MKHLDILVGNILVRKKINFLEWKNLYAFPKKLTIFTKRFISDVSDRDCKYSHHSFRFEQNLTSRS